MLKIAVPNKGSLSEAASTLLKEAGYRGRRDSRELVLVDPDNDIEFFFIRPRDIAVYVGSGTLDVGITGRDLFLDARANATEIMPLGFGASTFRFAGPAGEFTGLSDLEGKRIATSYDALLEDYLQQHGVTADVVRLDGAVESSVRLGVADAIADVVETGNTLRAAGMDVFGEPILTSEAVLIAQNTVAPSSDLDVLVRRLKGVIVAREYVMLDYDVPKALADEACALTPGLESPTVSPLANPEWVAVRAMIRRTQTNKIMDQLYELGARAILVTNIHASRI
ncbi:ATP phosphoribosyltransferase [Haematomicrobium sanguinis]|uniref:ATP phosphoribosyltransferase n=1 Tax=Haematomicrobium sanguinis TaxID=479106 RepID=UPI00047CD024|nr:ATP phosphoribosyltransferase [Haematomicrobium sanguinis]